MDDPLARFQREKLAHAISDQEEKRSRDHLQEYQAFSLIDKTDKTTRLQIRGVAGLTHSASYGCLQDVCYDGFHGTELSLHYSFMRVDIKGKNLQGLITAIEKHECAAIQNFDEQLFTKANPNDALIESINLINS